MAVSHIPTGWSSVIPYISVPGAGKLIDFVTSVFDAEVIERIPGPDDMVMHAEVRIEGSLVMLADACDKMPAMPTGLYVYVKDCDAAYQRGLAAGATSLDEPKDQFYGDRSGGFIDPTGNRWYVATHIEDVSKEEMERRMAHWKDKAAGAE